MFNVTVIDGKKLAKFIFLVAIVIIIGISIKKANLDKQKEIKQVIENATQEVYSHSYIGAINTTISSIRYLNSDTEKQFKSSLITSILGSELSLNNRIVAKSIDNVINNDYTNIDDNQEIIDSTIPDEITTQVVEDKNITATYTNTYKSVEIKNKSGYQLTEEMLTPDVNIENKKDIIIFHTHTCESYTPTEKFNYQMTR